ncbi:serine-protein kinase ATM isoform X3 [Cherax quadricarinatus]|uniref:serine-protein kinase ATM isoform X3 n=1 Tax=Cherax quadricarinatus TaxID=27406 RepID=UPI00387E7288
MALDSVKQCCRQLDSDRVLDRKKGSDNLKNLLNNASIVACLDAQPHNKFNWNEVFHSASLFFFKESKRIEEEERKKPEVKEAVMLNRRNLKRCAAELPKLVMKKSSLKIPHVSAQHVVKLVLTVLSRKNPYYFENFAGDFIQITYKYLMRFPQYYLQVTAAEWKDLMKILIWAYENELSGTDAVTIVSIMENIVKYCRMRGIQQRNYGPALVLRHLPAFLKKALLSNKLPSQYGLQSSLLSLLLTFTKAMANEWRELLCSIGEETFDVILGMWEERPTPLQIHWMEYLTLQIMIHHPQKGGEMNEVSSFVQDCETWQRCLLRLYQLIHDHIYQLSVKNKLASSSSQSADTYTIPSQLVTLTARLSHKIFQENSEYGVFNITQLSSSEPSFSQSLRPSKRRRIEVGLQPLLHLLRQEGTQLHIIPWYQILRELLKSYSAFFDQARCSLMLELFTYVLSECRTPAIQEHVMWCLQDLAQRYKTVYGQSEADNESGGKWTPVWDMTLRLVSGKQCSQSGLELLQVLMETSLVRPSSSLFKLFFQGHVDMTETGLSSLSVLLSLVPLPKYIKDESAVLTEDHVEEARIKLLNIILPLQMDGRALSLLKNPVVVAQLLLLLCLRDPSCAQSEWKKVVEFDNICCNSSSDDGNSEFIVHIEDVHVLSSLCCDLPRAHSFQTNSASRMKTLLKEVKILEEEEKYMIERVIAFTKKQVESRSSHKDTQVLLKVSELIIILLLHISDHRLKERLQEVLTLLTKEVEENLSSVLDTGHWSHLLGVMHQFLHLYYMVNNWTKSSHDANAKRNGEELGKHLLCWTPETLLSCMLQLVKTRTTKTHSETQQEGSQSSNSSRTSLSQGSFSRALNMEFEEFDEAGPSMTVKDDFQQFEADDKSTIMEGPTDANIILEKLSSLSSQDQCIVLALQWLVVMNEFTCADGQANESIYFLDAIAYVLEFSKSPNLETTDIAVMLMFVESLFKCSYNYENIQDGFEVVSCVCKKHGSQPQVAAYVVKIITDLINVHGSILSENIKRNVVRLAEAFANKQQQGIYGQDVIEAIFYLNSELSKVDPKREWSKYITRENDRCGEVFDLLCSPSHELRILAVSLIHVLLVNVDGSMIDSQRQDQVFTDVYQTALEALTVQGTVSQDFKSDEGVNRVSSFLLTLGVIALNSSYLEAKALFALCLAVPENGVDPVLVSRLLKRVSLSRGWSLKQLLQCHLPYLATQWIQHKHDIANFPACLIECNDPEIFLNEHKNILLPILFEFDQNNSIDNLARICGKDVNELYIQNFPALMAHILPYVAAEHDDSQVNQLPKSKMQAAKKHYKWLERSLGNEVFSRLVDQHVGDIMLSLLKIVHDNDPIVQNEVIVLPNPPYFSPAVIQNTLEFLGRIFGEDCPLVAVLAKRRSELHKVFQGVVEYLANNCTLHTARLALSSAAALVHSLLPHLEDKLKDVSTCIIRYLVHLLTSYTSSLQKLAPYLADQCNELLYKVCCCALEHCPQQLASTIPTLFARLLALTKITSSVKESTLSVIHIIFFCNNVQVQQVVSSLPPLPDNEEFQTLNHLREVHGNLVASHRGSLTLHDEVECFLSLEETQVHSVVHLLKMLQNHGAQIADLYRSEGVDKESVGHQLTYRLVTLASGTNEQVALEASRCLGELGPISLGSPVFYIHHQNLSHLGLNAALECGFASKIIIMLNRFLMSEDINVVLAAGSTLQKVLSTKEGYDSFRDVGRAVQEELILLFPRSKPKSNLAHYSELDAVGYELLIGNYEVWCSGDNYEDWVTHLACQLIEAGCGSEIISQVLPVCKVKPEFSAFMLPFIIHSALRTDSINRREVLSRQFAAFFEDHVRTVKAASGSRTNSKNMCINKAGLQVLLSVIDYLRAQTPDKSFSHRSTVTPWERNLWLEVNYLQVAEAAHYCGAHFSALLFLHLHCEALQCEVNNKQMKKSVAVSGQASLLMQISHLPQAATLGKLMLQVYSCLGDSDGVEGCVGASRLSDSSARALRSQHRGRWLDALAIHDSANCILGIVEGLREVGLFNTVHKLLSKTSLKTSQDVSEAQWESAWRLSQWECDVEKFTVEEWPSELKPNFHHQLFCVLQSLHHQDLWSLKRQTNHARRGVLRHLRLSRAESSSSIYPILSQLQILSEVEAAAASLSDITCAQKFSTNVQNLKDLWTSTRTLTNVEHKYKECILAARICALQTLAAVHEDDQVTRILHTVLVSLGDEEKKVVCQALNQYGCVLMDSRAKSPHSIIQDCFNKAVTILNDTNDADANRIREESFYQLATYTDKLYREVHQHLESDNIQTKRENIKRSREECSRVKTLIQRQKIRGVEAVEGRELIRKHTILERNINLDNQMIMDLEKQKEEYLYIALENYFKCFMVSSKHEMVVYRIVSLWLENVASETVNQLVLAYCDKIRSYHFVPLLYQLVARLSCHRDQHLSFSQVLVHLLERVCLEHPHHSLPVIIALTHAHADDDILKTSSKKQRCEVIEEDRVKAAKILVNSLKKTVIANHVAEFEKVSLAYLTLANWFDNSKHSAGDKVTIPSSQPLLTVRNLKYTAALTRPLRLQPSACYDPPLIVGWDTSCSFVGGINAPKRLTLKTSDGLKQFELLKGNDDIRQDAVMEQVFKIVNELLSKNGETRERGLSMRTYQVVPLSQRSGLIQWCNNTQAFGEYLIGGNKKGGAHKLYYPQDYTASTCREKMATVKSSSIQERYDTFQDILEHFHPVFRHFFMENYPSPHEWYKRRLAYTKSVATNSMVGYILGLGDRHVENILLDKSTAELIHIDLGIAFELGKILPTPETVPFRMTQDIIDGLGVMGVEGPLRQCCEATLGVLRSSGEVLVTLVEVLRHDPLHQWTLSPQQVAHLQATGDDEDQALNCVTSVSMADRVVLRVQQKLAGVEDGYSRTVAEQVNGLIQQATDHSNLSKLFPGWQPYL